MRDLLFVSHANPEDNEFSRWLTLQLASRGYPVWCDLTRLLGGEDFWNEAERAIRERTAKFLYVLSRASNDKPGARKELQVADNVQRDLKFKNFVIPLAIDDLPPRQYNIHLSGINAVFFRPSWAEGLAQLLSRLEEDQIATDAKFGPSTVSAWWREQFGSSHGIKAAPETLVSNFYPLATAPLLHFHTLSFQPKPELSIGPVDLPTALPCPAIRYENYLVSFASAEAFAESLGPAISIAKTTSHSLDQSDEPARRQLWPRDAESRGVISLLNGAWEMLLRFRALPTYSFAKGGPAFYFKDAALPDNRVNFRSLADGSAKWRQVVGFKTVLARRLEDPPRLRYWHFALEARPTLSPTPGFLMKGHLVFSDDGEALWSGKDRMHRANRSQRRNWWNDDWRDRMHGTISWLAEGADRIMLPTGGAPLELSATPLQLVSPVTFDEGDLEPLDEMLDDETDEDIEEEDLEEIEDSR